MIEDDVGCLICEPFPEDFDRDAWEQERQRTLDQYEEWLLSPF